MVLLVLKCNLSYCYCKIILFLNNFYFKFNENINKISVYLDNTLNAKCQIYLRAFYGYLRFLMAVSGILRFKKKIDSHCPSAVVVILCLICHFLSLKAPKCLP